ncbi:vitamin K epoxide reductase/DsbA family protein [Desulfocastanea catecholica]
MSTRRLPYFFYSTPVFLLLILGLVDTSYLAYSHYQNYTEISFNSFCALSKAINCDTVSQSPWSLLLGLPLAYWGFFAYLLFLVIFLNAFKMVNDSKKLWYVLYLLALLYSGTAVYFGYISTSKIKSYCILCLVSYAISISLLVYSWIILRRFCTDSLLIGLRNGLNYIINSRKLKLSILFLFGVFIGIKFYLPHYWHYSFSPNTASIPAGMTDDGHPWIGTANPEIIIHVYADYQCFQCSKMNTLLRKVIVAHPGKIQLIHHHYPMDHQFNNIIVPEPFHIGSGKMAMIGIYAAAKNKFWEMNDALYALGRSKQPFNTKALASTTGFTPDELADAIRNTKIRDILLHDIRQGMKLRITGTPAYVIDGKVYQGTIPADILEAIKQ